MFQLITTVHSWIFIGHGHLQNTVGPEKKKKTRAQGSIFTDVNFSTPKDHSKLLYLQFRLYHLPEAAYSIL